MKIAPLPQLPPAEPLQNVRFALTMTETFPILALSGFVDTLRHAADDGNRNGQIYCGWDICGPTLTPVTSSSGIQVSPSLLFEDLEIARYDYLVVIGGLMPLIDHAPAQTIELIREFRSAGKTVIGLCTGSFLVAQAGLLQGKRAAVHHRHRQDFLDRYSDVQVTSHEIFVEDENVVTSPGGTASIDLAIDLLARHLGRPRALKGLIEMSVDQPRSALHMPRAPSAELHNCGDWRVANAAQIMRENLSNAKSIKSISADVGVSVSQLNRLFLRYADQSPSAYWRKMRLDHAHWCLLNTNLSIAQIAYECGFSDSAHFIRRFKDRFHDTPALFRKRILPNEISKLSPGS
ncbi:GlxA family transcriptional regulator [Roseibium algae]|uniref:Helix-turn-helix domain-containing protein n=1 Tax=Roseibium algae TaxID=3123038 RepID=A0ABU8TEF4_9HYPH